MAKDKTVTGFQKKEVPPTVVTEAENAANMEKAKMMLEQASAKFAENITRYGYKEDKVVLTLLNGAIELL